MQKQNKRKIRWLDTFSIIGTSALVGMTKVALAEEIRDVSTARNSKALDPHQHIPESCAIGLAMDLKKEEPTSVEYDYEDDRGIIALRERSERRKWQKLVENDLEKVSDLSLRDWVHVFLYINKNVPKIPLFKELFLFNARSGLDARIFEWYPWNYGPYSVRVENELETLSDNGIIEVKEKKTKSGRIAKIYKLTEKDRGEKLFSLLPDSVKDLTKNVREFCEKKDIEELLHYVHAAYPAFATEAKEE